MRWASAGLSWLCLAALTCVAALAAPAETCPAAPSRLVVIGDSLADGLWGSATRRYARCATVEVLRLTEVSDGLAKSSASEWLKRYDDATAPQQVQSDLVLIQIGANDITTIRDGRGRVSYATDEWKALYLDRARALATALAQRADTVLWLGLPVVGKSQLEPQYQLISGLLRTAATGAGAVFVDIHGPSQFDSGSFAMNGLFGGRVQQLRASDKVHFTRVGYDFVMQQIQGDLDGFLANRDRKAALDAIRLQ